MTPIYLVILFSIGVWASCSDLKDCRECVDQKCAFLVTKTNVYCDFLSMKVKSLKFKATKKSHCVSAERIAELTRPYSVEIPILQTPGGLIEQSPPLINTGSEPAPQLKVLPRPFTPVTQLTTKPPPRIQYPNNDRRANVVTTTVQPSIIQNFGVSNGSFVPLFTWIKDAAPKPFYATSSTPKSSNNVPQKVLMDTISGPDISKTKVNSTQTPLFTTNSVVNITKLKNPSIVNKTVQNNANLTSFTTHHPTTSKIDPQQPPPIQKPGVSNGSSVPFVTKHTTPINVLPTHHSTTIQNEENQTYIISNSQGNYTEQTTSGDFYDNQDEVELFNFVIGARNFDCRRNITTQMELSLCRTNTLQERLVNRNKTLNEKAATWIFNNPAKQHIEMCRFLKKEKQHCKTKNKFVANELLSYAGNNVVNHYLMLSILQILHAL